MTKPVFMSQAHVDLMNTALSGDAASLAACKALDQVYWVAYRLDRHGQTVWWTMEFNPSSGMRFSLDPPADHSSLFLVGNYAAVVDAVRRSKEGAFTPPPVVTEGDVNVFLKVSAAFTAGQAAATFDTEFPIA